MDENEILEEIVEISKKTFEFNLVQAGEGNISIRGENCIYITPTFNEYINLGEKDIVKIDFKGNKISNGRNPSSEYRLHIATYLKKPRCKCIIHTHSTYASALSVVGGCIPIIFEEMIIFLGGSVECSEYAQANTDELPKKALKALGEKNSTLMKNHGVLAVGRTSKDALKSALLTEKMAEILQKSRAFGKINIIPENMQKLFFEKFEKEFKT